MPTLAQNAVKCEKRGAKHKKSGQNTPRYTFIFRILRSFLRSWPETAQSRASHFHILPQFLRFGDIVSVLFIVDVVFASIIVGFSPVPMGVGEHVSTWQRTSCHIGYFGSRGQGARDCGKIVTRITYVVTCKEGFSGWIVFVTWFAVIFAFYEVGGVHFVEKMVLQRRQVQRLEVVHVDIHWWLKTRRQLLGFDIIRPVIDLPFDLAGVGVVGNGCCEQDGCVSSVIRCFLVVHL